MSKPYIKTCIHCGFEGKLGRGFDRWDKLCKTCRAEVGPMNLRRKRPIGGLSMQQAQILELRAQGLTQLQIARRMGTTDMAIRSQLTAIRGKGIEVAYESEVAAI